MTRLAYVDASALIKLVVPEAESAGMFRWYIEAERLVTSRIGIIETIRAAARFTHDPDHLRFVLGSLEVIELGREVADRAAAARPEDLRALDAIQLATALELGDNLGAFVTYDDRLAGAARAAGFEVIRPA